MENKKYQWTIMFNSKSGSENYTIRTDDKKEFEDFITEKKKLAEEIVNPPMNTHEEKLKNFAKEYEADAMKCPKCGQPTKEVHTKTGKTVIKCSTAGWDRINMKATGCSYQLWK